MPNDLPGPTASHLVRKGSSHRGTAPVLRAHVLRVRPASREPSQERVPNLAKSLAEAPPAIQRQVFEASISRSPNDKVGGELRFRRPSRKL